MASVILSLLVSGCDRSPTPTPTPASSAPAPAPIVPAPPRETANPFAFGPKPVVEGPVAAALDEFFTRAVAHGFSGCVLVAVDDKVILHNAYGLSDRDAAGGGVPINLRTRFDVGSISKQFTSAAALRLVMQGKLKLDEPIVRWFDVETLGLIPERNRTITLKHLLSHTSGIPREFELPDIDMTDRDAVVAKLLAPEFPRPPGRTHVYSNANYFILAAVVERASGMPFEQALHELVFTPAGLTDTMICGEPDPPELTPTTAPASASAAAPAPAAPRSPAAPAPPRLADLIATGRELDAPPEDIDVRMDMGNGWYPHGVQGPAHRMPFAWGHRGATGVITTCGDLFKWHTVLAGDSVLSDEMRELIVTPAIRTYAMGWEVGALDNGMYMVGHSGSAIGFEADFRRYFPDEASARSGKGAKVVTVITSNARAGQINILRQVLERALLKSPDGSDPALPQPPADPSATPPDPRLVDTCLGIYTLPSGGELMVIPSGPDEPPGIRAVPLGQDAAIILDPPTAHAAPIFQHATRRTERALKAWVTRAEPDARELRRSVDPTVSDETLAQWTAEWTTSVGGPLVRVRPIASLTVERQLQTFALLEYPAESRLARVLWKEDSITDIRSVDEFPIAVPLVAETTQPRPTFASAGEQWWLTLRMEFDPAGPASGASPGVVIRTLGREVRAERAK
jgi:CubicO group peptidase (beta-lactamase class C family)